MSPNCFQRGRTWRPIPSRSGILRSRPSRVPGSTYSRASSLRDSGRRYAGFYNRIRGYIYGEETGRLSRVLLPIYQFQSNDALLAGFEGSLNWDLGRGLALQAVASSVRGTLTETDRPIPLIPPLQGHVGIEYERPAWFVGWDTEMATKQDRVGAFESPTKGYTVFNASAGARLTVGGRLNVITVSLNNVTNREYRNHLSRVKEIMPEAGRGVSLSYRVVF